MALLDFLNKRKKSQDNDGAEMSFIDHLEELRWHIIRSLIAVAVAAIVVFIFIRDIVDNILFGPTDPNFVSYELFCRISRAIGLGDTVCVTPVEARFQSNTMTGQFISSFTIAFLGGFIVAFPYVFWEFWKFVKPALTPAERKKTKNIVFWVSLLFFTGVFFGYFILTPFMVNFYFNYKLSDKVVILPSFSDYLENLIYLTVGIGVLFQMPLLIMLLAKVGIITADFLRRYRRHAIVMLLIAAAIITPTTDPFSLSIVTIPLYLLYEAGIKIAAKINKRQDDRMYSDV
ncbi:MAG: twin-arginine translocase subunit TatC [Chitinophagaceae bacterium]|nr:twin-arginine translocase subunit TatC [Chitinophagaceae bacterium]